MVPFYITLFIAAVAILLIFLGRQMKLSKVYDAGVVVGILNTPLLAFLLRGVIVIALAVVMFFPSAALAGTSMPDYSFYCYYVQVWHGQYQHIDRSDRVAVSQQLSYPYHYRLFYQAYGYHN